MTLIDSARLLGAKERRYAEIEVEGLGRVRIRSLFEGEMADFEAWALNCTGATQRERGKQSRRRLIALCVVDQQGERLISDDQSDQLAFADGKRMVDLYKAIQKHVGYSDGELEELAKNSDAPRDCDSPTESPSDGE